MKKITLLSIGAFLLFVLTGAKGCFLVPEPMDGGNPDDTGILEDPEDPMPNPDEDETSDANLEENGNDDASANSGESQEDEDSTGDGSEEDIVDLNTAAEAGEDSRDMESNNEDAGGEEAEARAGYVKFGDIKGESDDASASADTKESGEKAGTADINIGVGELQE